MLNILLSTADVNDHKRIASVLNDLWLAEAVYNTLFSFYKNIFYKNIEAEICEILRIL